jgi:23S rRNA pseudouridine2605 synthase
MRSPLVNVSPPCYSRSVMTEPEDTPAAPEGAAPDDAQADEARRRPGERLAKAIARAGLGSRREAEGWIEQGRVVVNGETVTSPNLNVEPGDRVEVDGRPLPARERTRLWLYHKPRGYVTTTHDPEGRETVFSILPESLPRVMTVGRLDINTEGLLLLTNDGGLARVLELPETGWLRRYRVRAFGKTDAPALEKLKDGVEIDGFSYGSIDAEIERQQKDNVWLRFGLREGKNREVKRVAEHLGLSVNRLIRISFGPFQLGDLPEGGVEEVRTRTLIDQLGKRLTEEAGCDFDAPLVSGGEDAPRKTGGRGGGSKPQSVAPERSRMLDPSKRVGHRAPIARPRDMPAPASKGEGEAPETKTKRAAPVADRKGRQVKVERVQRNDPEAAPKRFRKKDDGAAERFGAVGRPARPERPGKNDRRDKGAPRGETREGRPERSDRPRGPRPEGDRPFRSRPEGDRPQRRSFGDGERPSFERPRHESGAVPKVDARGPRVSEPRWREDAGAAERPRSPRPPRGDRPDRREGDRPRPPHPEGDRPRSDKQRSDKPWGDRPGGDRKDDRSREKRSFGDGPSRGEARPPREDRPRGERSFGDRPARTGDRPPRSGDGPRGPGKPRAGAPGGRPTGGKPGGKSGGGPRGPRPGGAAPRGGSGGKGGRPGGADRRR